MSNLKLGMYRHYKGGLVKVLYTSTHSETLEEYVVYEAKYNCRTNGYGSIWVRPLVMFMENVDGKPRFEYVGIDMENEKDYFKDCETLDDLFEKVKPLEDEMDRQVLEKLKEEK